MFSKSTGCFLSGMLLQKFLFLKKKKIKYMLIIIFKKTSTGPMNSIELEKNKICHEWWMILVFSRELFKTRPNAEDIFAVFNL